MSYKPKAQVTYCGAVECVFNAQQKTSDCHCTRASIQIDSQNQCQHFKPASAVKKKVTANE